MPTYKIPSQINQSFTVSKYELLMNLRGKKIFGMIAITVAIAGLNIGFSEYFGKQGPQALEFDLASPISFVYFLIVIIAVIFGSSSISSEFNQKTGQILFSNPVSRTSIWVGKFFAAEIIAFSIIALYYSMIVSYASISNEVPIQVLTSLLFSFVSATMLISIAFFTSSIFRGQTGAAVVIFALFVIVFPMTDNFTILLNQQEPWFMPTFSSGIITHVLTVPYPSDDNLTNMPFFVMAFIPKIETSLGVMASYIVVSSALSIFIFKRKELS